MLLSHIDNTEPYRFVIDRRNTLCIVFATQAMLEFNGPVAPLWHREAGNAQSLDALIRWVAVRRDRWQEWGRLAEALGREEFYQHMRQRMEAEPPALCTGTVVQCQDDPVEVMFGGMMHGPQGLFLEPLYTHRFASPEARDSFYGWLWSDGNHELADSLVHIAFTAGTAELGRELDRIAADPKPLSRAERRRGAKAETRRAA